MKPAPPFDRLLPLDDPGVALLGCFAGARFVAAFKKDDGTSMLAEWPGPDAEPEAITGIDARVVAIDASRDGARVALAAISPEGAGTDAPAPAQLFVLDLATREGQRYIRPEMRLSFAETSPPRVLFSDDGHHLAVGALANAEAETVAAYVVDLGSRKRVAVLEGVPVQWWDGALRIEGARAIAWSPGPAGEAVEWSGALDVRSPDGAYTLRSTPKGELLLLDGPGEPRALPRGTSACWIGPHHLSADGGAFDVRAFATTDLARSRRDAGVLRAAHLVALAPAGDRAVFRTADDAYVWALGRGDT